MEEKSQIKLALASSATYKAEVSLFASNVNPPQSADLDGSVTDSMQFTIHGDDLRLNGKGIQRFKAASSLPTHSAEVPMPKLAKGFRLRGRG